MAVYEVRHAPRCKFCKHAKVTEINLLCEKRAKKDISPTEWTDALRALGMENPNAGDGWKTHWGPKKHYYMKSDAEAAADREALKEAVEAARNGTLEEANPDEVLKIQLAAYKKRLLDKIALGEDPGLTHDHAIKVVSEMTKRKHNEAQDQLLHALTGGIAGAFAKALNPPEERPALNAGEVDAEEVVVEDSE